VLVRNPGRDCIRLSGPFTGAASRPMLPLARLLEVRPHRRDRVDL
jgi:hypothetical protein